MQARPGRFWSLGGNEGPSLEEPPGAPWDLQRPPRKHLFVSLDLCSSQMSSGSGRGFLNLVFDPGRKASTSELLNRCLIHRRRELVH